MSDSDRCPSCGELPRVMKPNKPATCSCGKTIAWDKLDDDRSIPALDQHLKTITENGRADMTRMDKILDYVIGKGFWLDEPDAVIDFSNLNPAGVANLVTILTATAFRPHLKNRQKLMDLIEASMPTVSQNETAKGGD
jgi:hypothetical protein